MIAGRPIESWAVTAIGDCCTGDPERPPESAFTISRHGLGSLSFGVNCAPFSLRSDMHGTGGNALNASEPEPSGKPDVLLDTLLWRNVMTKLGILGATALSLSLAIAGPALAQHHGGGGGGGGGAHVSAGGGMGGGGMRGGGGGGGMRGGGGGMRAAGPVGGAQASIGPGQRGANFAGRGAQFQGNGAQFAGREFHGDRNFHGGRDHGFRHRGFGPAFGFGLGYGYGGYYDPYYYDDYAYNDDYYDAGPGYDTGPAYEVSGGGDPAYCAQRYKSYDPASGTYLGYDGLRHPCP